MKKNLAFLICIAVFIGAVWALDFALYPCTYMRNDVHSVTTEHHDVLFLGTSNGKMNIDPDTVLDGTGLSGHNLCNGNQFPVDSYHLLQLAIDANSTRCTALLLNHKAEEGAPEFSLDEFTLDDLPAYALAGRREEVQGDNGAMKLLFPEEVS